LSASILWQQTAEEGHCIEKHHEDAYSREDAETPDRIYRTQVPRGKADDVGQTADGDTEPIVLESLHHVVFVAFALFRYVVLATHHDLYVVKPYSQDQEC